MEQAIMETVLQIAATLLITLIGVLGAWLTAKIAKNQQLSSITQATAHVIEAAQMTVGELQQTVVDKLKAANGGKLADAQIAELSEALLEKTYKKLSDPALKLLDAVAVDIDALIKGAGEEWIKKLK